MEILFWITLLTVVYAYAGYPLMLSLVSVFIRKPVMRKPSFPKVSIIMSAFNEEKNIEKRLRNLMELDYPQEQLEILIGSDGASDKTDEMVSHFPSAQIRFFRFVRNQGKPSVLNELIKEAHGTILVFADMRQEFDAQAVKELVSNFADTTVGCVSGELYFKRQVSSDMASATSTSQGMGAYWNYEKFLRKKESEIASMLGATGAIYAIRRKLFRPIPSDILVDDMYIPLSIVRQGYRAVFDSEAKAYDRPSDEGKQEFKRKVRTLAGNYQIFAAFSDLFNPFKSPVAFQMISHKLLRVLVPFFLIGLAVVNMVLILHPFYLGFFVAQAFFYGLAAFEALQASGKERKGLSYLSYTFCLLNYSALVAGYRYLKGNYRAAWEKAYE